MEERDTLYVEFVNYILLALNERESISLQDLIEILYNKGYLYVPDTPKEIQDELKLLLEYSLVTLIPLITSKYPIIYTNNIFKIRKEKIC